MYNVFSLKNGLRVVIENIDYVNSVSVGLWIENGSRNEGVDNNGISHFIEHMLFKGTNNRTAKEIAECIEGVGGQINAFTGKEATCFYIKLLYTHLELALDVLSDMLFNSKFLEEDIEKEKGVITEEINMSSDSPEDVLSDLHCTAIWGNDSITLPILGEVKTIKSFTRKMLIDYISSYYIPENSVISIAGKFNQDEIEDLVTKYFGSWKSSIKHITSYSKPEIQRNHIFKEKKIEQLHMSLGIPGLETGSNEIYSLLLLCNVFGGGASSLLFQKIREEKGMCYSIYSYISAFKNTGIVTLYAALNPNYAAEAVCLIKDEIKSFAKEGISKEKLYKAKEQLKGSYILGLESTSSRMFNNGKSILFLNKINTPEDIIKKINNINSDSLEKVIDLTFKKGIYNSSYVGASIDMKIMKDILQEDKYPFDISRNIEI
jgi:predicted Zn-dependent peptidase